MTKLELIVKQIRDRLSDARNKTASEVNTAMLQAYWDIGRIIVEHEQDGEIKAQYGQQLLTELAKELTKSVGRGFSKSNLYNMRNFYLDYQIFQTVSGKLTWSHYCELLGLSTMGIMSQRMTRMNTNKNKKLYLCYSRNSLIKTGEEIEYFV
jgi:hypothetical protein